MAKLEDVEGVCTRAYLKQLSEQFNDLRKYVDRVINSRKSINEAFNARLERLEKEGK